MTNKHYTVCDVCGTREDGKDEMDTYYEKYYTGPGDWYWRKVHACEDCTPNGNWRSDYPVRI